MPRRKNISAQKATVSSPDISSPLYSIPRSSTTDFSYRHVTIYYKILNFSLSLSQKLNMVRGN